jgi:hypothetical protein
MPNPTNTLDDDEVRRIVREEVGAHVLAFPHPTWEALDGDNPDSIVAKTHFAAEQSEKNAESLNTLIDGQMTVVKKLDLLADVVLGEEQKTFDGAIVRDGGLQKLVRDSHNGGLPIKLPSTVTAALVTAMAGIFTTLLILIFQHV